MMHLITIPWTTKWNLISLPYIAKVWYMNICIMISWLNIPQNKWYINPNMVQFWLIIKELNPFQHLSTKIYIIQNLFYLPYFLYFGNVNELNRSAQALMIFRGDEFLGVGEMMLSAELHIFLTSEKHLIWNLTCVIKSKKLDFLIRSSRSDFHKNFF